MSNKQQKSKFTEQKEETIKEILKDIDTRSEAKSNFFALLCLICWAVCAVLIVAFIIHSYIFMFSHPELTRTQLMLAPENYSRRKFILVIGVFLLSLLFQHLSKNS